MSDTPLTHVDLSDTIGAVEIGSLFAVFLFGILTLQTHIYYITFPSDRWTHKLLVAVIWILEVGHTAGVSYEVYRVTIILYGRPQLLVRLPGFAAVTVVGGLITYLTQLFFSRRIFKLLPRPYNLIGIFCMVAASVRMLGSFYLTVQGIRSPSLIDYRRDWKWLVSAMLGGGAAIDVIIAVSMLYYLFTKRGNTLERASRVIDQLIAYTLRTGLLTRRVPQKVELFFDFSNFQPSLSAIAMLIAFQTRPESLIWLALYAFLAKLYSNSILSALNARHSMREEMSGSISVERFTLPRSQRARDTAARSQNEFIMASPVISIEMKTTTGIKTDDVDPSLQGKESLDMPRDNPPRAYRLTGRNKVMSPSFP
ncbi:unnamed protein product [Cyclocybe aegerita]|uniref:DUF6534 domain-containing protein n=1 Tax=Cyclocybe aegerita TaxID=1973307 RepID=A0A8S0VRI1_CYCAE|nr:unnamed protein product [Cyclocybe aegerita]